MFWYWNIDDDLSQLNNNNYILGYVGEWLVSKHAQLWQSLILNSLLVVKGGGGDDRIIHCMFPVKIMYCFKNTCEGGLVL